MFIRVLSSDIANMIAAGEVVERPASVVKELCENAVDAGADAIEVEIAGGGLKSIRITDNGTGIHPDDVETAFVRHATSKIQTAQDLDNILTLGFRGEALASIASISKVKLYSRPPAFDLGTLLEMVGGEIHYKEQSGCQIGTTMIISDLFYNTPARLKFLKRDYTEAAYVEEAVRKLALSHPHISFRLITDHKEKLQTDGGGSLLGAVRCIYGSDISDNLCEISYNDCGIDVEGYVGNAKTVKKNRSGQLLFLNGRSILNKIVSKAIEEACKGFVPIGTFPVVILQIKVSPVFVDVNVHPAKLEVKFRDDSMVYHTVYWAVKNALAGTQTIPVITAPIESSKQEKMAVRESAPETVTMPIKKENVSTPYFGEKEDAVWLEIPRKAKPETSDVPIIAKKEEIPKQENMDVWAGAWQQETTPVQVPQNAPMSSFAQYRLVGQILNTYIIIESNNKMVLIDQHATHERITYDQLAAQVKEHKVTSQMLLTPENIQLSPVEYQTAVQNMDFFAALGFDITPQEANILAVSAIPNQMTAQRTALVLSEMITNLQTGSRETTTESLDTALKLIACHGSVRGGRKLLDKEIDAIVQMALKSPNLTCPHGRPISVAIDKYFIEKLFKRK